MVKPVAAKYKGTGPVDVGSWTAPMKSRGYAMGGPIQGPQFGESGLVDLGPQDQERSEAVFGKSELDTPDKNVRPDVDTSGSDQEDV